MNNKEYNHLSFHEALNRKDDKGNFILTPFPHEDDYLEPYIGPRTVKFHYGEHLRAYINNVNSLKKDAYSASTIEQIIYSEACVNYNGDLYRNASQVFNHYFYFEQLNPRGDKQPLPITEQLIEKNYGSWSNLRTLLIDAGMSVFGSGWIFLATNKERDALWIEVFEGTKTPIIETPILALDVWEHAYYLDYQNDRKTYIENFFRAVDWSIIENRLIK